MGSCTLWPWFLLLLDIGIWDVRFSMFLCLTSMFCLLSASRSLPRLCLSLPRNWDSSIWIGFVIVPSHLSSEFSARVQISRHKLNQSTMMARAAQFWPLFAQLFRWHTTRSRQWLLFQTVWDYWSVGLFCPWMWRRDWFELICTFGGFESCISSSWNSFPCFSRNQSHFTATFNFILVSTLHRIFG